MGEAHPVVHGTASAAQVPGVEPLPHLLEQAHGHVRHAVPQHTASTGTGGTGTDSDSETGTSGTTGEPLDPCPAPLEEDGEATYFGGPSTEYTLGFAVFRRQE